MLVLNTNDWVNLLWRQSNMDLNPSYPDFSQILMLPWWILLNAWQSDWAWTIYWINFHSMSRDIYEYQYKNWTFWTSANIWWQGWVQQMGSSSDTQSNYNRFISRFKLKGWEIIWKNIQGSYYVHSSYNTSQNIGPVTTYVKIYLVHSDWSTTLVWTDEKERWNQPSSRYSGTAIVGKTRDFSIETNWVTAQEWDVILIELELKHTALPSTSYSTNLFMYFWCQASPNEDSRPRPIQISIE